MTCVVLLLVSVLSFLGVRPASAGERYLAPGAQLHTVRWRGNRYYYVKLDLDQRAIGALPSRSSFPMGLTRPVGSGIASVGADFKCLKAQPCHLFVRDREIWTTGVGRGGTSYVQARGRAVVEPASWFLFLRNAQGTERIHHVNYGHAGVSAFTVRGGTTERPSSGRCYLDLVDPSGWRATDAGGWSRTYVVRANRCGGAPPGVQAHEVIVESLKRLAFGVGNPVDWVEDLGLRGGTDVVSGMTPLVDHGRNVAPGTRGGPGNPAKDGYYYEPCPRAVLAVSNGGTTAFELVVDGLPGNRAGVRFPRLARFLVRKMHVTGAFNLDGGGSAMLWTRKYGVVSHPSYGYVRPTIFATVVR